MARKSMTIEEILNMNKVDSRKSIPPGFPPAPPPITDFRGNTEEEYKEYMKKKLLREQWENSLLVYRMREKEGDTAGMQAVIDRITNAVKISDMSEGEQLDPLAKESKELDTLFEEEMSEEEKKVTKNDKSVSLNVKEADSSSQSYYHYDDDTKPKSKKQEEQPFQKKQAKPKKRPVRQGPDFSDKVNYTCPSCDGPLGSWLEYDRRYIFFIPGQILLSVMIIISTAVSNTVGAILCGIIFGLIFVLLDSFLVWERRANGMKVSLVVYAIGELIAFLFGIIGGFQDDGNFVFYLGIPGVVICAVASVVAWFFILKKLPPLGKEAIAETF